MTPVELPAASGGAVARERSTSPGRVEEERLILVGKTSYIGGRLSQYMTAHGAKQMTSLSSGDCNFLEWDQVARFFTSLDRRPSTLVFLAVINKPAANSFQSYVENIQMVKHLIEGQKLSPINAILYFSSIDVYGRPPHLPLTEQSPINPESWYALAKYTCEWMLRCSGEVRCPVTILRIPGVYGWAPHDKSIIGQMISRIRATQRATIHGSGTVLRDYVYVDDLCRLVSALLPVRYDGVLNVATGRSYHLREIMKLVRDVLHLDFEIVHDEPDPQRDFDLAFDTRKLTSLIPSFQFSEMALGIRSYLL